MTGKIKKYEISVYSYKNQIRNLKKSQLYGGEINIQLINVFVNAICNIVEYICTDVNKPVLAVLPLIHSILNSTTVRDKKIHQCTKLIHRTLTQIESENVMNSNENITKEETEENYEKIVPHKLEDLEWIASETNDKGWLTISDRWELCKIDLKWLCIKTNNRSWLLYRHLWENCSNDLKYISVLFDDKQWLHLHNIWKYIPLSLKLRAISSRNPSVCKPSLTEIILKNDDMYQDNMLEFGSQMLNVLNLSVFRSANSKNVAAEGDTNVFRAPQNKDEDEKDISNEVNNVIPLCIGKEIPSISRMRSNSKYRIGIHEEKILKSKDNYVDAPKNILNSKKFIPKEIKQSNINKINFLKKDFAKSNVNENVTKSKYFLSKVQKEETLMGAEKEQTSDFEETKINGKAIKHKSTLVQGEQILTKKNLHIGIMSSDESNSLRSTNEHTSKTCTFSKPHPQQRKNLLEIEGSSLKMENCVPILKEKISCVKNSKVEKKVSISSIPKSNEYISITNEHLEDDTTNVREAKKISPTLGIKTFLKMKEQSKKKFNNLLKKKNSKEILFNLNKIGGMQLDEVFSTRAENGYKHEGITIGKMNKVNIPQREKSPKKSLEGNSNTYLSNLFNAFNFARNMGPGRSSNQGDTDSGSENGSKHGSQNGSKHGSQNGSEHGSQNGSKHGSQNGSKHGSQNGSEHGSQNGSEHGSQNGSEHGSQFYSSGGESAQRKERKDETKKISHVKNKEFASIRENYGEMEVDVEIDREGGGENKSNNTESRHRLKTVRRLRDRDSSTNLNVYSISRSLKEYSMKREFLKTNKSISSERGLSDVDSETASQSGSKIKDDFHLNKITNHLDSNKTKEEIRISEKSKHKFSQSENSGILQKVLNADLSHFNYDNKRMSANEIAKHKNASLHITLKRKVSFSSLKMKIGPKR
ncbi:hypothetical protein, conserved [Plasmodium gonderi]|uniref:Uncharacterized protein n=1 Tax=Plasmodium gonderi TaxID=77519 RepID=A0A1Y1JDC5_PLAGO|nr:hypothetical protein, conserved [Plasmodium gonderi]GAW79325.1 hypothetical protein, conserved [Plasmodium gonderi]